MRFIINNSIPEKAIGTLRNYGQVISISSSGITYPEISGHPDIFICQIDDRLIVAPNSPSEFKEKLKHASINTIEGTNIVGNSYPETAHYNAVVTNNYLIHNLDVTDDCIKENCKGKTFIHVNQAYTRCNLLPMVNNRFITSDKGIFSTLTKLNIETLLVNPEQILLPGFKNGFFGGACGVIANDIFIIGRLSNFEEGKKVVDFLKNSHYNIIELYDGPLYDGGSIFIME